MRGKLWVRFAPFLSKRYVSSSSSPSCSATQPWLFIGLGNPGEKYQSTRHNVSSASHLLFKIQVAQLYCHNSFGLFHLAGWVWYDRCICRVSEHISDQKSLQSTIWWRFHSIHMLPGITFLFTFRVIDALFSSTKGWIELKVLSFLLMQGWLMASLFCLPSLKHI